MLIFYWWYLTYHFFIVLGIALTGNSSNIEKTKYNGYLPKPLYYTFGIDLDSLTNNTNEISDVRGEMCKIKQQKGNITDFYNDFYIWGRFNSTKKYKIRETRFKAISNEDKLSFKNIYFELLPENEKELFPYELDLDSLDCYFMYQYPFRSSRIRGFNLLMFERKTKTYYYLKSTGRYVKEVENGIEIEPNKIREIEYFTRNNNVLYTGRARIFPFIGWFAYIQFKNLETRNILSDIFFKEAYKRIFDSNKLQNTIKWMSEVDSLSYSKTYLHKFKVDTIYYKSKVFKSSAEDRDMRYELVFLAKNKSSSTQTLSIIHYSDFYGENQNKYIYNPLEESKDEKK